MTPIISPWIIYGLSICDGAKILLVFCQGFALIVYIVGCIVEDLTPVKKRVVISICVVFVVGLLIPSKTTALQMLVAQNVTYERVDVVGETIVDIYNDIVLAVGDGGDG